MENKNGFSNKIVIDCDEAYKKYVRCIRTDCDSKEVTFAYLRYTIKTDKDGTRWLHLLGGPTGYESCDLDKIVRWAFKLRTRLLGKKASWSACFGADTIRSKGEPPSEDNPFGEPPFYKAGYDKLDVPASEIRRIVNKRGLKR